MYCRTAREEEECTLGNQERLWLLKLNDLSGQNHMCSSHLPLPLAILRLLRNDRHIAANNWTAKVGISTVTCFMSVREEGGCLGSTDVSLHEEISIHHTLIV